MREEIAKIVFSPVKGAIRTLCSKTRKLGTGEMIKLYQQMITNALDPEYYPPTTVPDLLDFAEIIAIQVDKKLFTSRS